MKRGMVFVVMALLMLYRSVAWGGGPAQELISYSKVTTNGYLYYDLTERVRIQRTQK